MARVYVSLGSNIERRRNLRHALDALNARYGPLTCSEVYESEAVRVMMAMLLKADPSISVRR